MSQELFNGSNAALLLIDHQVGVIGWVNSMPQDLLKRNAVLLAKVAKIHGMPIVITSSMEAFTQGPIIKELAEAVPEAHAARIQRMGIINAMEDEGFAAAVRATGRKNIVLAGVTNDVCTVFPALSLVEQGFAVQVIADAGGSPGDIGEAMALRRMERGGVMLAGTNQIVGRVIQVMMATVA
jgi:nicotinamidase-related amidase